MSSIQYGDPANTPDVAFGYDTAGNRTRMTEYGGSGFTSPVRETLYGYDDARRLTSVGFDTNADNSVDETVSYEYDAGGLRTKLTLPGGTDSITYVYNARGELVSLIDWDDQETRLAYDNIGRHIATVRPNGLRSRYTYDPASRLRLLRHTQGQRTLDHFAYEVDGRGNRTQALEVLPHPATTSDVTIAWDDDGVVYRGSWTDDAVNGFKEADSFSASLRLMFFGNTASLTFGVGPDHSIFDVYIGKTLWESFDGYAATFGEQTVDIPLNAVNGNRLAGEGPHLLELRNRPEKNAASSGYSLRFKQLVIPDVAYDLHTIRYQYDALSRLLSADYHPGINIGGPAFRQYAYTYDLAGNRLSEALTLNGGSPAVTNYTYNAANQIAGGSFAYDNNGNLTNDGVNSYTWDRANRLLTAPGSTAYQYDGAGNRIQQTVSSIVTDYLLDVQPGLAVVLRDSDGTNTNHYVHATRGVHSRFDGSDWSYYTQDGLGSVRGVVDAVAAVTEAVNYTPYGVPDTSIFGPAFTGEWRDESEVQYHRARYMSPEMGTFLSLDPFEGMMSKPMSLNGYNWVEGNTPNGAVGELIFHNRYSYANANPVNLTDPSGLCAQPTQWWNPVDVNCYYSAVGLAQRFSGGNVQAYNEWFDVLIKRSWPELKGIELLGTVNDATILPSLALRGEPGLVLEVFRQFSQQLLCGVGSSVSLAFLAVRSGNIGILGGSAAGTGVGLKGLIPGIAVGVGIGIGLSALLGLNAFVHTLADEAGRDDDEDDDILYHYTDENGYQQITSGPLIVIRANQRNQVFLTREEYGPYDAWIALFIGNPNYRNKGEYYIKFVLKEGVPLVPGTQPNELIHYGSMTEGKEIKQVLNHGPNPFEDKWKE